MTSWLLGLFILTLVGRRYSGAVEVFGGLHDSLRSVGRSFPPAGGLLASSRVWWWSYLCMNGYSHPLGITWRRPHCVSSRGHCQQGEGGGGGILHEELGGLLIPVKQWFLNFFASCPPSALSFCHAPRSPPPALCMDPMPSS